jgi:hypothetical protein
MTRLPPLGIIALVPIFFWGSARALGFSLWSGPDGFLGSFGLGIALFVLVQLTRHDGRAHLKSLSSPLKRPLALRCPLLEFSLTAV